jgi:hypothetical protein
MLSSSDMIHPPLWQVTPPLGRMRIALPHSAQKAVRVLGRGTDEKHWQKRFEEDLVEMMARMGHEPGEKVTLRVRDVKTRKTEVLKDVPNTHENRQAIRQARNPGN